MVSPPSCLLDSIARSPAFRVTDILEAQELCVADPSCTAITYEPGGEQPGWTGRVAVSASSSSNEVTYFRTPCSPPQEQQHSTTCAAGWASDWRGWYSGDLDSTGCGSTGYNSDGADGPAGAFCRECPACSPSPPRMCYPVATDKDMSCGSGHGERTCPGQQPCCSSAHTCGNTTSHCTDTGLGYFPEYSFANNACPSADFKNSVPRSFTFQSFVLQSGNQNQNASTFCAGPASLPLEGVDATMAEMDLVMTSDCDLASTELHFRPLDAGDLPNGIPTFVLQNVRYPTHCLVPAGGKATREAKLVWRAGACSTRNAEARFMWVDADNTHFDYSGSQRSLAGLYFLRSAVDADAAEGLVPQEHLCVHPDGETVDFLVPNSRFAWRGSQPLHVRNSGSNADTVFTTSPIRPQTRLVLFSCYKERADTRFLFRPLFMPEPAIPDGGAPFAASTSYLCTDATITITEGNAVGLASPKSLDACKAACSNSVDCVAAVWRPQLQQCEVKFGAIISTRFQGGTISCVASRGCPELGPIRGYGPDVVTSARQCLEWCQSSAACTSYDFSPTLSKCVLNTCPLAEAEAATGRGPHLDYATCFKPEWTLGTTSTGGTEADQPCLGTLSTCLSNCAADERCDYVLDRGCDSNLFDAVGQTAVGIGKPTGVRFGVSPFPVATDSNGFSGYADEHRYWLRSANQLADMLTYPALGWDDIGSPVPEAPSPATAVCLGVLARHQPVVAKHLADEPNKIYSLQFNRTLRMTESGRLFICEHDDDDAIVFDAANYQYDSQQGEEFSQGAQRLVYQDDEMVAYNADQAVVWSSSEGCIHSMVGGSHCGPISSSDHVMLGFISASDQVLGAGGQYFTGTGPECSPAAMNATTTTSMHTDSWTGASATMWHSCRLMITDYFAGTGNSAPDALQLAELTIYTEDGVALTGLSASTSCSSYNAHESPGHAVDNVTGTRFTCWTGIADLIVTLNGTAPIIAYDITTADDRPYRDPHSWTFSCRPSVQAAWVTLHTVVGIAQVTPRQASCGPFMLDAHCIVKKPPPVSWSSWSSYATASSWTPPAVGDVSFFPGGCEESPPTSPAPAICVRIITYEHDPKDGTGMRLNVAIDSGSGYSWVTEGQEWARNEMVVGRDNSTNSSSCTWPNVCATSNTVREACFERLVGVQVCMPIQFTTPITCAGTDTPLTFALLTQVQSVSGLHHEWVGTIEFSRDNGTTCAQPTALRVHILCTLLTPGECWQVPTTRVHRWLHVWVLLRWATFFLAAVRWSVLCTIWGGNTCLPELHPTLCCDELQGCIQSETHACGQLGRRWRWQLDWELR